MADTYINDNKLMKKMRQAHKRMHWVCYYPKHQDYGKVGGKGIKVCPEWRNTFENFATWSLIHGGFGPGMTLLRKDKTKDYSPSNCEWVERNVQHSFVSTNRHITAEGRTKIMQRWAEDTGIRQEVLSKRLKRGLSSNELLSNRNRMIYVVYKGEKVTLTELSELTSICVRTLYYRYTQYGNDIEELTRPVTSTLDNTAIISGETLSLRQIARYFNIKESTLVSRYISGDRDEELIKPVLKKNIRYLVEGKMLTVREICERYGIARGTVKDRIRKGWDMNKVIQKV